MSSKQPDAAATTLQCFWRRIVATRRVSNKRLWKWCIHKNATHIQCAWRSLMSRRALRLRRSERQAERDKRLLAYHDAKFQHLLNLIRWHGFMCDTAACVIQSWYRSFTSTESPRKKQSMLVASINLARKNRDVLKALEAKARLDMSEATDNNVRKALSFDMSRFDRM